MMESVKFIINNVIYFERDLENCMARYQVKMPE